jgi:hypothetical protein
MADARVSGAGVPAGGRRAKHERAKAQVSVVYKTHQNAYRTASIPELSNQNMMEGSSVR